MCMACEEEALWRRYQLALAVERDEIPPGFEPEDFEWAGLPVPSKRALPIVTSGDPSSAYSRASGNPEPNEESPVAALDSGLRADERGHDSAPTNAPARNAAPVNPFACDAPDDK
jgi:hypothetical protein